MPDAYSEEEITASLMALIAWAGNATAAKRWLDSEGKRAPVAATLLEWSRTRYIERYDELRSKYSEKLETNLANELRDVARLSLETQRLAIERAREALEKNQDRDPGRTAANLSTVTAKSTDKLLALTGRPSQITENRDVGQILRSLVAKGVLSLPEEPKTIEGTADET